MTANKLSALLGTAIIPQIVNLIVESYGIEDIEATKMFYSSKTYEVLSNEESKVWHFSPLTLFNVWKCENETGEVIWPEEAL